MIRKIQSLIKTISKQMYLSQWRDGDELEKELGGNQVFVQRK